MRYRRDRVHPLIIARLFHAYLCDSVFPYAVMWNFYRNFHNYTGEINDDHMIGKVRTSVFLAGAHARKSTRPTLLHTHSTHRLGPKFRTHAPS